MCELISILIYSMFAVSMESQRKTYGNIISTISVHYVWLALFRFLMAVIPQTGYIHPDEYFQSTEILIGNF